MFRRNKKIKTVRKVPTGNNTQNKSSNSSVKSIISAMVIYLSLIPLIHLLIKELNEFYFFNGINYERDSGNKKFIKILVKELKQRNWFDKINTTQIHEIISKYKLFLSDKSKGLADFRRYSVSKKLVSGNKIIYFNLRNGILKFELDTREKIMIYTNREKYKFLSYIDINYDPNNIQKISLVSKVIRHLFPNSRDRRLFYLWKAYSLLEDDFQWEVILMLYGYGRDGKSTILDSWSKLFRKVAYKNGADINQRFGLADVYDTDHIRIKIEGKKHAKIDPSRLKAISSGEPQEIELKRKDSFTNIINAKISISANYLLSLQNTSDYRRILALRTTQKVKNVDAGIKKNLPKELADWFHIVLNFIPQYYEEVNELIIKSENRTRKIYDKLYDPFSKFMADCIIRKTRYKTATKDIWRAYDSYRNYHELDELSIISVGMSLGKRLDRKSVFISTQKGFIGIKINDSYLKTIDPNWK